MLLIITLLVPFILFIGGSSLLNYPRSLGVLYAVNVTLIYIVLWLVLNQAVRINSQKLRLEGGKLTILRKQLFTSLPLIRVQDIEIPVADIREVLLVPTGVGYQMTVRFTSEDKIMGVDIDLNPLTEDNPKILRELLRARPELKYDEKTEGILVDYNNKISTWKQNYVLSIFVITVALAIFLVTSIYLGSQAILPE